MNLLNLIQEYILGYNSFFYWRNCIEILFFTLLIYYFSLWLKADRKKNLLPYFYGYCTLTLVTHFTQLTTISYFLFLFAPVAIMLFILIHQTTLQRNFVALKNIVPAKNIKTNWPETVIRSFLFAINKNKEIHCVIESKDSLEEFLFSPLILNANIQQGLIHILYESQMFDQKKMLWLNTNGQLVGINSQWRESVFAKASSDKPIFESISQNNKKPQPPTLKQKTPDSPFVQNALLLSSHTDALFLQITPQKRTFDIIFNGELFNNINSDNALNILKKYAFAAYKTHNPQKLKKELIHKNYTQKTLFKQTRK